MNTDQKALDTASEIMQLLDKPMPYAQLKAKIQDANRWISFIKASGLSYDRLSEEWLDFFSAQSDPQSASTELVRLIDLAIAQDGKK